MNENEKQVKAEKKAENKAWLLQRINELGIENLLYPIMNSKSHPYTKEVMLIAETQGYKQNTIAAMCGVSQSQVSQWLDGQGKANLERITPLINKLSPRAPGEEFHIKTVVSKTTIEFPEDWELQMLLKVYPENEIIKHCQLDIDPRSYDPERNYYNSDYRYYPSICASEENLEKAAIGNLEDEYKTLLQEINETFVRDKEGKEKELSELRQLQEYYIEEKGANETLIAEYEADKASYLENNKPLLKLSEEDRNEIVSNNVQSPEVSLEAKIELTDCLGPLNVTYNTAATPEDSEQIATLVDKITQELSLITCQLEQKTSELNDSLAYKKLEKSIFNQFDQSIDMSNLVIDDCPEISVEKSIIELGSQLYGETCYRLKVQIPNGGDFAYSHRTKKDDYEFEINMAEAFIRYCKSLKKIITEKDIQICGELLNPTIQDDRYGLSNKLNAYKSEVIEELKEIKDEIIFELRTFSDNSNSNRSYHFENKIESAAPKVLDTSTKVKPAEFECYQLFSKRLLLIHNHNNNQSNLSYAYSADNAEIFLAQLSELMAYHEWDEEDINEKLEEYKSILLKRGYRLDSVDSIY